MRWFWLIWVIALLNGACANRDTTPTQAPQALPPIMIALKDGMLVDPIPEALTVGDFVVFTGDSDGWQIRTTTPEVVLVSQGGDQGGYTTNPGGELIAPGTASIELVHATYAPITVTFTVQPRE